MIFATVGTQLPFPRLMRALDALAPELGEPIIAQAGTADETWPNLDIRHTLTPAEYDATFAAARLVVAHAGIGTLLTARKLGKPLVILPRRCDLGEHRNDHQQATAKVIGTLPGVHVAWQAEDLPGLLRRTDLAPATDGPSPSREALIARLKGFVDGA